MQYNQPFVNVQNIVPLLVLWGVGTSINIICPIEMCPFIILSLIFSVSYAISDPLQLYPLAWSEMFKRQAPNCRYII